MRTTSINAGDIVHSEIRGQGFYARVVDKTDDGLAVEPLDRRVTFRNVTARQIVGHYRKAKGSR
jgi:hypothetical protein